MLSTHQVRDIGPKTLTERISVQGIIFEHKYAGSIRDRFIESGFLDDFEYTLVDYVALTRYVELVVPFCISIPSAWYDMNFHRAVALATREVETVGHPTLAKVKLRYTGGG